MYVQSGSGYEEGPLRWSKPQLATLRHAALGLLHSLAPCFPQVYMCSGPVCTEPVAHVLRSRVHRNCSPCVEVLRAQKLQTMGISSALHERMLPQHNFLFRKHHADRDVQSCTVIAEECFVCFLFQNATCALLLVMIGVGVHVTLPHAECFNTAA